MNPRGASRRFLPLFLIPALTSVSLADSPKLKVGSVAPPIKVQAWMQGTPVTSFQKGKVYVVEFWATWCGPCVQSMPHLTKLSKQYKGKATFTGVDVWEDDSDSKVSKAVPTVKKFLKDNPGRIGYNVAVDGKGAFMAKHWLEAAGQDGIPSAFIIDQKGKIAWIGHPMDGLDEVLPKVIANKFDPVAYAKSRPKPTASADQPDFEPLFAAIGAKDFAAMIKAVDKLQKDNPKFAKFFEPYRTAAIAGTDLAAATATVDKLIEAKDTTSLLTTGIALVSIENQPKPYYALAVKCIEAAPIPNDQQAWSVESMLAQAYSKAGDPAKAVEHYEKALALAKTAKLPDALTKSIADELAKAKAALPTPPPQG